MCTPVSHVSHCATLRVRCVTDRKKERRKEVPVLRTVVSHVCCRVSHTVFAQGEHSVSRLAADSAARPFPKGVAHSDPKHTPIPEH